MKVTLYGVRGSLPSPLRNTEYRRKTWEILNLYQKSEYQKHQDLEGFWKSLPLRLRTTAGGDTTCIQVRSRSERTYVVDFGTGARALGDSLVPAILGSKGEYLIDVFITHTHWDHIQAIPFFKPLYFPNVCIRFHSPYADLETRLKKQMEKEFFPIEFQATASQKEFHLFQPGEVLDFEDGKIQVEVHPLKHPGNSYAYKFRENGKVFIFATDAEFTGEDLEYIRGVSEFFQNAELLILDSQYTLDESFAKFDWGHTSYTMAVNIGDHWKVKNLALTHHEPSYDDKKIFSIWEDAKEHLKALGCKKFNIYLAREGMTFVL